MAGRVPAIRASAVRARMEGTRPTLPAGHGRIVHLPRLPIFIRQRHTCVYAEPAFVQAEQFDDISHARQHRRDPAMRT